MLIGFIQVGLREARAYMSWLSAETGEMYRFPSESEWEYAARAGTETAYSWGNEIGVNRANCQGCGSRWDGERMTAPVGSFDANAWGLYDMHGNVWERVEGCWNENYAGAPSDGTAWIIDGGCFEGVVRGGSWLFSPRDLRSANRLSVSGMLQGSDLGFRVARTLTP